MRVGMGMGVPMIVRMAVVVSVPGVMAVGVRASTCWLFLGWRWSRTPVVVRMPVIVRMPVVVCMALAVCARMLMIMRVTVIMRMRMAMVMPAMPVVVRVVNRRGVNACLDGADVVHNDLGIGRARERQQQHGREEKARASRKGQHTAPTDPHDV